MSRSTRHPMRALALSVALAGSLGIPAAPALAKDGWEATIAEPFPIDALAGSTIEVVATITAPGADGQPVPAYGYTPMVSVYGPSGDRRAGYGHESDQTAGEYRFPVVVPPDGLIGLEISIAGRACTQDAAGVTSCVSSPMVIPIVDPPWASPLPSGWSVAAPPSPPALAAASQPVASPAPSPAPGPGG